MRGVRGAADRESESQTDVSRRQRDFPVAG
jgi:hypothetical protein